MAKPKYLNRYTDEGYADIFYQEGRWWGFAPNAVMPVELKDDSAQTITGRELDQLLFPVRPFVDEINRERIEEIAAHLRSHQQPSMSVILHPNIGAGSEGEALASHSA